MESATRCGMELRHSRVWNQAAVRRVYTLARDAIRLRRFHTMRKRIDSMPSLREPQKLAHSLPGTPTAAWIKKSKTVSVLLFFWSW